MMNPQQFYGSTSCVEEEHGFGCMVIGAHFYVHTMFVWCKRLALHIRWCKLCKEVDFI